MKTLLLAFAILAAASAAQAQQTDALAASIAEQTAVAAQQREAEARALAERRQRMIDECIENHGYEDDCVRAADTELRAEGARVVHLRAPQR
ncbi:MAG TPA: hypothetical protein VEQ87_00950 [Burkholderiales bacterium]|nr:hypothetical protein [Burkholderiales bacterium]